MQSMGTGIPNTSTLYALLMAQVGTCCCRCAGLTSVKGKRTVIRLSPVLLHPVRPYLLHALSCHSQKGTSLALDTHGTNSSLTLRSR